jgi:hypothetical protein
LIDDDDDCGFKIELGTLAKNIKKEVIGFTNSFFFFLRRYNEEKIHNMLALMLNPRFNNLTLKYSFIVCELGVAIVEKYHRKSLFLIFLMSYHHLHSLFKAPPMNLQRSLLLLFF